MQQENLKSEKVKDNKNLCFIKETYDKFRVNQDIPTF